MKQELSWVNNAKAICMMVVYFYHTSVYSGYPSIGFNFYSPFFVTSFFFISGYLFFSKHLMPDGKVTGGGYFLSCKLVLFKIVIPTILFSLINFFPKTLLRGGSFDIHLFLRDTFLGGSLWFTSALALAEILLSTMIALKKDNRLWHDFIISVLLTIGAVLLKKGDLTIWDDGNIPWFYKAAMIGTFYLVVGGLYKQYESKIGQIMNPILMLGLLLVYVLITLTPMIEVRTAVNAGILNIWGVFASVLGIVLLTDVCKKLPTIKLFNWVGRHTLVMYFLSGGIPNILSVMMLNMGVRLNFASFMVLCSFSFIIGMIGTWIIEKYFPFVIDLRKISQMKYI